MDAFNNLTLNESITEENILQSLSLNDHNLPSNDYMDLDYDLDNTRDQDGDSMMDVENRENIIPYYQKSLSHPVVPNFMSTPLRSSPLRSFYTPMANLQKSLHDQRYKQYTDRGEGANQAKIDEDLELSDHDDDDTGSTKTDSANSSILSQILSPTRLGARLATSNSILPAISAANEPEEESRNIDLSYSNDFKGYKSTPDLRLRKNPVETGITAYRKTPRQLMFKSDEDPKDVDSYSEDEEGNNTFTYKSAMKYNNGSLMLGNAPVQLQLHHHHYYPNPVQNQLEALPAPWETDSSPKDRTPYMLSSYLQLLLNFGASCYALFLLYGMVNTIKFDVSSKLEQEIGNIMVEMASCRRSYEDNACSPETIVPALEEICSEWEKCMNRDPYTTASRSTISAETVGMIINSLVEPMGLKSVLIIGFFVGLLFLCNLSFGFLRAKSYYGWGKQEIAIDGSQNHNSAPYKVEYYKNETTQE